MPPPTAPTSSRGKRIETCSPPRPAAGPVRHRAGADHPEARTGGGEHRRDRRRRGERDRLHPDATAPCVPAHASLEVVDRRPQHAPHRRVGQRTPRRAPSSRARAGSTRTTASCRRPCSPRGSPARPHRRAAAARSPCSARTRCGSSCSARPRRRSSTPRGRGTSGRPRGSSPRAGAPAARARRRPTPRASPHRRHLALDPARELRSRRRARADEAGRARDPVGEHVRPDDRRPTVAPRVIGEREPALGVRERHDDVLARAADLDDLAALGSSYVTEVDRSGATDPGSGDPVTASAADANGSGRPAGGRAPPAGRGSIGSFFAQAWRRGARRLRLDVTSPHRRPCRTIETASFLRGQRTSGV